MARNVLKLLKWLKIKPKRHFQTQNDLKSHVFTQNRLKIVVC